MAAQYFFLRRELSTGKYFIDRRQANLINAIGKDKYCGWKNYGSKDKEPKSRITFPLYFVDGAYEAADFVIHVYSQPVEVWTLNMNTCHLIMKQFGIDEMFLGTIYSIQRGINIEVIAGNYVASSTALRNVSGVGPNVLMAIADLKRNQELQTL